MTTNREELIEKIRIYKKELEKLEKIEQKERNNKIREKILNTIGKCYIENNFKDGSLISLIKIESLSDKLIYPIITRILIRNNNCIQVEKNIISNTYYVNFREIPSELFELIRSKCVTTIRQSINKIIKEIS